MIAAIIISPLIASCQKEETLINGNALLRIPIVIDPSNTPSTVPFPPFKLTPPITQAAMTSISIPFAASPCADAYFDTHKPPQSPHSVPIRE